MFQKSVRFYNNIYIRIYYYILYYSPTRTDDYLKTNTPNVCSMCYVRVFSIQNNII